MYRSFKSTNKRKWDIWRNSNMILAHYWLPFLILSFKIGFFYSNKKYKITNKKSKLKVNWNKISGQKRNWNTIEIKIFREGESEIQSK